MELALGQMIVAVLSLIFFLTVVVVLRTRRGSISRHPYRDPNGDTPGASRTNSALRDVHESIRTAPGTR
jgi:hypothetical protein